MGMSEFYAGRDDTESVATLERALELGVTFLDTADVYGPFTNEALLGRFLRGRRQQVDLATKFGILRDPANPERRGVSGKPEYVRRSCEGSLRRLGIETIDLYYQHRVDPDIPIEETVGAMAELVREGKVRYLGLSEAGAATLRRADAVHHISALQSEYSLWSRDPEDGITGVPELGIGFVAHCPPGRGFDRALPRRGSSADYRRHSPRFRRELPEEPRPAAPHRTPCGGEGVHEIAARAGLGARPGSAHRADSRDKATSLVGGECRGTAGHAISRGGSSDRRPHATRGSRG
jgi:aryl-alcohol dehydrogenase-like predicted oxidoreductase